MTPMCNKLCFEILSDINTIDLLFLATFRTPYFLFSLFKAHIFVFNEQPK